MSAIGPLSGVKRTSKDVPDLSDLVRTPSRNYLLRKGVMFVCTSHLQHVFQKKIAHVPKNYRQLRSWLYLARQAWGLRRRDHVAAC